MERPKGVTVLAYVHFIVALSVLITFIPGYGPIYVLQRPRLLAMAVGALIISVTLGIGLLRMKNWSRWLAIIINAANLLFLPHQVAVRHTSVALIRAGLSTLIYVWIIWYLTRPHVKTAFQSA